MLCPLVHSWSGCPLTIDINDRSRLIVTSRGSRKNSSRRGISSVSNNGIYMEIIAPRRRESHDIYSAGEIPSSVLYPMRLQEANGSHTDI